MKIFSYIPAFLKNKYLLASTAFVVWMVFFDRNDLITQYGRKQELKALEESKAYYADQIARERQSLEELQNNPAAIEKYARERHGMKRDNEDLFIVMEAAE